MSAPPTRQLPKWALISLAIGSLYLLLVAIGVIGDGFKALGKDAAEGLFEFATNPFIALFVGILATAIIQSSSTTTAIVVTLVGAGAVPMEVAIPMVMGANIGTSVTNTLASLGHAGKLDEFKRAFTAATVHDYFNLSAVAILLPLELIFHPIEKGATWLSNALFGTILPSPDDADFLGKITDPVADLIGPKGATGALPLSDVWIGMITILLGVLMIFLAVRWLGKLLQQLIVGKAQELLEKTVGGTPLVAMGTGALVTVAAQSSSVTTSIMVPFAGSGALTPRQIYPMTLGANVGTTVTTLIAALAVTGDGSKAALTIALVHLLFNLYGIVIIYGIPFLRPLPLKAAEWLAGLAAERKILAIAYVLGVFIIIPGSMILAKVALF
ncbi:MAG TPA: Na/Pi symporter [Candidatus Corynebacterium gallistercoris]|uniref:Na/Pi symporter n=1 Tax=Candidatus Corynebacterium gallistercoris TaxID=2838530 RepID=A0A9D1URD2_9CORY|nr:Na/Pi symporter [Candidatus Corynebacterium gallistercoris]